MRTAGIRTAVPALVLASLLLTPSSSPGAEAAAPLAWQIGELRLQPILSNRLRTEVVDWFDPGPGLGDESYTFVANVVRFGASMRWRSLAATLEGQDTALWNVPSDAPGLGPGAAYYSATTQGDQHEVHLRRAVLQWNDVGAKGLSLAGGRYILNEGTETTAEDSGLQWIKKNRVSQRLVGGFDYTHVGRSFDGATLRYVRAPYDFTFSGGRPSAGGFNVSANNEVEEVGILYAALTATEAPWLPRADARLFYLYYADDRGLVATDNRPLATRQADGGNIAVHTVGANLAGVIRLGPGDADGLFWVAGQSGDWEALDHAAWALAVEGGYRLVGLPGTPWLRAGWFHGSGDSDPGDGKHDTFFQALPTARLYAQTPFFNLMNNEDLFLQAIVSPRAGLQVRVDWHHLWTSEGEDLLYSGAGAAQSRPAFGFGGFASRGHSSVGDLLDLSAEYAFHRNAKLGVYYGHVFGDSVLDAQFAGSGDADYGYVEVTLGL
jgi:hypothetical protein